MASGHLAPELSELFSKRKLIPGHRVHKRAVLGGDLCRKRVFGSVPAEPRCRTADGALVERLEYVLDGEAEADDAQHDVIAALKRIGRLGRFADRAVKAPVIDD